MSPTGKRAAARRRKARPKPGARRAGKRAAKPATRATKGRTRTTKRGASATKRKSRATRRPRIRVLRPAAAKARRRAAPKSAAPAFGQRSGASSKQLVLFDLMRSRAAVLAALQGLAPASAEQPMGEGRWSAREVVLHLVARDRARLREMEVALRGVRASWMDVDHEEMDRINAADLASLRPLGWDEAWRLLHTTRHQLIEVVESVPEEPVEVWETSHPFGWMMRRLPAHDLHHAEALKRWRAQRGV